MRSFSSQSRRSIGGGVLRKFFALLTLAAVGVTNVPAQTGDTAHAIDLGVIVTRSRSDAEAVLKQLNSGTDFFVLAKEKSIDATATDGGYMGKLDPDQLRGELREALRGHGVGQLTDIVQLPSGFTILKVLAAAPATTDLNPTRISSLIATGAIWYGAAVDGLTEANAAVQDFSKPDGWNRDLHTMCEVRRQSLANAKELMQQYVVSDKPAPQGPSDPKERIDGHSLLAQLYGYSGEMDKSIAEWKAAYDLAVVIDPKLLPNIEESLGASYLHLAEMENGIYRDSSELDIFPPLHPHTAYERKDESRKALEYFEKYLKLRPDSLEVKWLVNMTYMTLGEYPSGVPAAYLIPKKDFHSQENIGRFVDVAPAAGLNVFRGAGGVIVDDFDNDGLLDVVVSSLDVCDPLHYFHNDGDGKFSDRSEQAGLLDQLGGLNLTQVDYNNDGCMDILVLRGGWEFAQRKSLLRNNCNGTFTDVTDASGLGATVTSSQAAAWADIDNDGYAGSFSRRMKGCSLHSSFTIKEMGPLKISLNPHHVGRGLDSL
jgi:tetratricopeptide (TPR) repeat protein